jgi:hypothetical protein
MSDQRLIVPSDTPSAWAACDVDKPSGLPLIFLIALFQRVLDGMKGSSSNCTVFDKKPGGLEVTPVYCWTGFLATGAPDPVPTGILDTRLANASTTERSLVRALPDGKIWINEPPPAERISA